MMKAEKLKKKFPEIEDSKRLKTKFKKMEDRNQQHKEDSRSAEAALKTREEQLKTTEKLQVAELEKYKELIKAEEERTFKAYEQCAKEK